MCIIKQTEEVEVFAKCTSISTALLLFIAVIFYASLRYHTETDYKTLFAIPNDHDQIPFPVVTLCPLTPAGQPILNPTYYKHRVFPATDSDPEDPAPTVKYIEYRGAAVACLQYNWNPATIEQAMSQKDALVLRFGQNLEGFSDPYMMTGAIGIVHLQGDEPSFTDPPMFYAPLGQTTQVSLLNYYVRNTKRELTNQYFVAVPAIISDNSAGIATTANISQVILAYNQFGYYLQSQFQVYTVWMWIGEVGGAAALMYLLQHAIVWAAVGCARRTCFRKQRAARKAAEAAAEAEAAESVEMSSEPAYPVASVQDTSDPSDPPSRGARKNRRAGENSDGSTRRPRKPKNNDRVVIDMDSMEESQ